MIHKHYFVCCTDVDTYKYKKHDTIETEWHKDIAKKLVNGILFLLLV